MSSQKTGRSLMYDAWNRLMSAGTYDPYTGSYAYYSYDALGRRITDNRSIAGAGGTQSADLYYTPSWQVVEERRGSTVMHQYVWSLAYIDALVLRDSNADGDSGTGSLGQSGSGLEQRLLAQQDANFNTTALVSTGGAALERYVEEPYGTVTVLAGDWSGRPASQYQWIYLHQGGRFEPITLLYHFRHRDYSSNLGVWVQKDPIGYGDGMNVYQYVGASPILERDPQGLFMLVTDNLDIQDGLGKLRETLEGRQLLDDIVALEARTGVRIYIDIAFERSNSSGLLPHEYNDNRYSRPDLYAKGDRTTEREKYRVIRINPLDKLGYDPEKGCQTFSTAIGDGPLDFEFGKPLDEVLYHELTHAKRALMGTDKPKGSTSVPAGMDPRGDEAAAWRARWDDLEEKETTDEESRYRVSKGKPPRSRYVMTPEQKRMLDILIEIRMSTGVFGRVPELMTRHPVWGKDVFLKHRQAH